MTCARSISLVLAIAIAPLLSSCASRSIPPAAQIAPATQTALAPHVIQPLKKSKLTGAWHGSWQSSSGTGAFSMKLTQKGKKFFGSIVIAVSGHDFKGTVKGSVRKTKLTISATQQQLGHGKGTATTNKTRTTMKGAATFSKFGGISFNASKG